MTVHAPERLVVRTDPGRFRQVVDALADNALRVTPAGRPLVLDLAQAPGGTGGAVLEVRDGGPGLAPEDYPVAFERGVLHARYRAERAGSSGIGLNLVAGLVSRLADGSRPPRPGGRRRVPRRATSDSHVRVVVGVVVRHVDRRSTTSGSSAWSTRSGRAASTWPAA